MGPALGAERLPARRPRPRLLLWDVRRFLSPGGLGPDRVVVQLTFPTLPAKSRYF